MLLENTGPDSFLMEELARSKSREELNQLETKFIIELNACNPDVGYNGNFGGTVRTLTEETKRKIGVGSSLVLTGRKLSSEHRANISLANLFRTDIRGRKKQTHCKRGHAMEGENLYVYFGKRRCRACLKLWWNNRLKESLI